jgi:hypothetical protein
LLVASSPYKPSIAQQQHNLTNFVLLFVVFNGSHKWPALFTNSAATSTKSLQNALRSTIDLKNLSACLLILMQQRLRSTSFSLLGSKCLQLQIATTFLLLRTLMHLELRMGAPNSKP